MRVSIIIPTYKRAHLLDYVLDSLKRQTCKDFNVVAVLKPCGDGSEGVIERYKDWLEIDLVLQRRGYVVDALNLGLEHASGDVVAFLDDDAVPGMDWIERHVESYRKFKNVGGVAGNVIPAKLCDGKPKNVAENASQVIPSFRTLTFFEKVLGKAWNAPIEGMEDFLVFISKAGVVEYNLGVACFARHRSTMSLLGMGANMSVLREAIKGFKFPKSWILGLAWEQFLGWQIWKKDYNLIFNPEAYVYHLIHGETLTRNIKSTKKDVLCCVEGSLLFYRLYGQEPKLSNMHRIAWLIMSSIVNLKKLCKDKDFRQIAQLKGKFYSEVIGLKWLLSRKIGGTYEPLLDLQKLYC